MSSVEVSIAVFTSVLGAALLGMYLSYRLPADLMKAETRTHIQTGVGLLTSMFALLLSLQLSSGKTSFDRQGQDVTLLASKTILLDRVLATYGPETEAARKEVRTIAIDLLANAWPGKRSERSNWTPGNRGMEVYNEIDALSPTNESQRTERAVALQMAIDIGQMRWQDAAREKSSTAVPLMIVEIAWATIIFFNFGFLAPRNIIIFVSLAISASAVSGGFFLIVELNTPSTGLLHVSSGPVQEALRYLAR